MMRSMEAAELWFVMRKAAHWCHVHAARSVSKLDLCVSDFAVLSVLRARGPLRPDAIGKKVLLTSGSVTSALDRLEREKLTERRTDPSDGRASLVFLTDRGAALARQANDKHTVSMEGIFSVLNEKERNDLRRLLKKLGKFAQAAHRAPRASKGAVAISAGMRRPRRLNSAPTLKRPVPAAYGPRARTEAAGVRPGSKKRSAQPA
jgi:MarR family 2-MHQ and catechol resistance regulon transcriptional repressor